MAPHNSIEPISKEPLHGNMAQAKNAFTLPGKPFFLYSTLPYYIVYFIYIGGFIGLRYYENPYWMITLVYFGFPLLDCISHDWLNPDKAQQKELEHDLWFKVPLFGLVILDNVVFWYAVYFITQMEVSYVFLPGALFLVGSMAGHHFLVAHEIFHKHDNFHRIIGTLTVMKSLYMHFFIEHNYGHHKNVATLVDPATARYGESVYQFLPRSIIGSYKSAWNIEKRRMLKIKGFKTHWMPHNKMIWFTASKILIPILVFYFLGLKGLIIYLIPAAISVIIFETVNYIEHYGLLRKELAPGEYEKINVTHSWNAPHRFSNYLLLKLQRHSDHHENSYKPYQMLLSKDESPMLPHGYLVCILISFFPQIWFRIMDRRLLAYKEGREMTEEENKLNKYDSSLVFITLGVIFATLLTIHYSFGGKF